jgi:hypothetical protein
MVSRRRMRGLAMGCALAGVLMAFRAHAEPVDLSVDRMPLGAFVERIGSALGSPIVSAAPLEGTVSVHCRAPVTRDRARRVLASIAETHGLRTAARADGRIELRRGSRDVESVRRVLSLAALLDLLVTGWPAAQGVDSVSVVGPRGSVTLLRPPELEADAIRALQDALSDAATRPAADPETPAFTLDYAHVLIADVLRSAGKVARWTSVSDAEVLLRPAVVDIGPTEERVPAAAFDVLGRALLGVLGQELREGSSGLRHTRALRAPDVERIPPTVAARLAKARFDAKIVIRGGDQGQDLSRLLEKLSELAGLRLVWSGSCPRRLLFWGDDFESNELAGLVGAPARLCPRSARIRRSRSSVYAPAMRSWTWTACR